MYEYVKRQYSRHLINVINTEGPQRYVCYVYDVCF